MASSSFYLVFLVVYFTRSGFCYPQGVNQAPKDFYGLSLSDKYTSSKQFWSDNSCFFPPSITYKENTFSSPILKGCGYDDPNFIDSTDFRYRLCAYLMSSLNSTCKAFYAKEEVLLPVFQKMFKGEINACSIAEKLDIVKNTSSYNFLIHDQAQCTRFCTTDKDIAPICQLFVSLLSKYEDAAHGKT